MKDVRNLAAFILNPIWTLLLCMVIGACKGEEAPAQSLAPPPPNSPRTFAMGFTPWPWDATNEAITWTYDEILKDGDIVSHHIEQGVPWNESLNATAFPASFQSSLTELRTKTPANKKIVLQLNSLSGDRSGLALYRTDSNNAPLPAPWNGYALNHANVKTAYLSFVKRVADILKPDFIVTGIEANILRSKKGAAIWAQFVELQCSVYKGLKSAGYTQPVSVSFVTQALYHPEIYATEYVYADQVQALKDIEPCADIISWSMHPFISGLLAESVPSDYYQTIFGLTSKPQAISESSYPAQVWSMPSGSPTWNGSPEKQSLFLSAMLAASQQQKLKYLIWFTARDYDLLWNRPVSQGGLGQDTLGLVWRDTGLFNESGNPRSALDIWRLWFAR